jgi:para-aminobenzoate synthetase/4-amino-4-deoxychorismate lyase
MTSRPDPRSGVFETLLVVDGRPVELDAHLARLERSLHELFGALPPAGLRRRILRRAEGMALARLRLTVAPARGGDRLASDVALTPIARDMLFSDRAVGVRTLALSGGLGPHKWADRRFIDAAGGPSVPLIVDADGAVLEASRANVFLVLDGALVTPRADGRLLPGVARRRVLELAREDGMDTAETGVGPGDLGRATEVFLTNSVRGIEPVRALDGRARWGAWPTATQLARRLGELWACAPVEEASRWP